jgi:hypothetical protein
VPRVSTKAPRRAAALLVATGAVLLAAACGGGSDSSNSSSTGGQNANGGGGNNAAFTAYIACLNKNGVTIAMPSGGVRGNRPSDGASRSPREFASGQPRPSGSAGARGGGFPGGGGFFQKPANVDDATWTKAEAACASVRPSFGAGGGNGGNRGNGMNAAYANCLKQHGVTDTTKLDTGDATVKKAMETCKVLSPAPSASPTA